MKWNFPKSGLREVRGCRFLGLVKDHFSALP